MQTPAPALRPPRLPRSPTGAARAAEVRGRFRSLAPALAFGALTAASAAGQCPELDHLVPPDTTNLFGRALALDGDTLLVGSPADHGVGNTSGAIYFYERAGDAWVEADKVHAAPGAADQYFGWSVDVAGEVAVVGAQYAGEGAHNGLVFGFEKTAAGWTQRVLWSTDTAQPNGFGHAVATDGTHIALGEAGANVAWVYFRHSPDWFLWDQLFPWDSCEGWPRFGAAVAVDDLIAYVGAPGSGFLCPGAVYVFDIDHSTGGPKHLQKLTPSDPTGVVGFGRSLAIDGERLVVGTEPGFGPGTASGRAYVFEREAGVWVERAVLQPHDSGPLSQFGVAVAVEGDRILVGDTAAELPPAYDGAAYLFQRESDGTWSERQKFVPAGPATDDDFGRAVGLDGDVALVGAPQADVELGVEGAVYRFPAAPRLLALDPPAGAWYAGADVTLVAAGLQVGWPAELAVAGAAVPVAVLGPSSATAVLPPGLAGAGPQPAALDHAGTHAVLEDGFTVLPALEVEVFGAAVAGLLARFHVASVQGGVAEIWASPALAAVPVPLPGVHHAIELGLAGAVRLGVGPLGASPTLELWLPPNALPAGTVLYAQAVAIETGELGDALSFTDARPVTIPGP